MPLFTGTLNTNAVFAAIFNMIISQQVFSDNIAGGAGLADKARVDGSLYGDTKLYYSTDVLNSHVWGGDLEAPNLLALHRPPAPSCQSITLNVFRQIDLTVDSYLTKQAWKDEGAFASFNGVMQSWMSDTKKVYDFTTYSAFLGCDAPTANNQTRSIALSTLTSTDEELDRQRASMIANGIANILSELCDDVNRVNDLGYLRKWEKSRIKIVWNIEYVNEIEKRDLPTIFHKDDLFEKVSEFMPARFFGAINSAATAGDGSTVRSLIEQDIGTNHYFAGDLIAVGDTAPAGTSYTQDSTVICKILVEYPPLMSAFEVGTSFFNPKSLTENMYLTWGHNSLEHLYNYPLITVSES